MDPHEFAAALVEIIGTELQVSPVDVTQWESEHVSPPVELLLAAAEVAKVEVNCLLGHHAAVSRLENLERRVESQDHELRSLWAFASGRG